MKYLKVDFLFSFKITKILWKRIYINIISSGNNESKNNCNTFFNLFTKNKENGNLSKEVNNKSENINEENNPNKLLTSNDDINLNNISCDNKLEINDSVLNNTINTEKNKYLNLKKLKHSNTINNKINTNNKIENKSKSNKLEAITNSNNQNKSNKHPTENIVLRIKDLKEKKLQSKANNSINTDKIEKGNSSLFINRKNEQNFELTLIFEFNKIL